MKRAAKGVAVRGVNIGDVRALQIALPPREEQVEIVRRVTACFELAEAIERRVASAATRAEKLTQAVLSKAFRAELVATEADLARQEARDYEPASVLVERMRGRRDAMEKAPVKRPVAEKRKAKPLERPTRRSGNPGVAGGAAPKHRQRRRALR
jgi:type I restriction enzyme S subunit